jgi:hypothetical protein
MPSPQNLMASSPFSLSLTATGNTPNLMFPSVARPPLVSSSSPSSGLINKGHTFYDAIYGHPKHSKDIFEPKLVFVIMSFSLSNGGEMLDIYSAIKDECAKLKLKATRVDENVGGGFIIGETITLIKKAEFIICDLTHERPNVYYELGYAHAIGNQPSNILMIAREGTAVHFDLASFRVQFYLSTEHLRTLIAGKFKDMVQSKRAKDEPSSPIRMISQGQ